MSSILRSWRLDTGPRVIERKDAYRTNSVKCFAVRATAATTDRRRPPLDLDMSTSDPRAPETIQELGVVFCFDSSALTLGFWQKGFGTYIVPLLQTMAKVHNQQASGAALKVRLSFEMLRFPDVPNSSDHYDRLALGLSSSLGRTLHHHY